MFRLYTKALARQVPTVVVLAGLGLLGWWGAAHEWHLGQMFPWLPGRPAPTPKPEPEPPQNPSVSPDDVKLDSPDTTAQAGIETGEAKRQGVTHTVRATGVLAFDQTRYAHSAARVSGTAWRVFAGAGKRVVKDEVLALVAAPEAGKARADFLAAWVSHDVKAKQVERFQEAGSSIPERQIRDARELLREAKATMLNAHQALANLGLDVSLDALHGLADDKVYQRVRHLGLPSSVVGESNLSASLIPITAPLDGVVIRRDLVLGEQAGPGQTAFVLADKANSGCSWTFARKTSTASASVSR